MDMVAENTELDDADIIPPIRATDRVDDNRSEALRAQARYIGRDLESDVHAALQVEAEVQRALARLVTSS